ncbi:MAG TPA: protein tyrosine phosphatase family protein [Spongiibacteraceae bacterium]
MSVKQAYNYKEIDARISTAGMVSAEQLACLRAEGYEAVINLLPEESQYALKGERAIVENQGASYCQIPVDFNAPTRENYDAFCAAMASTEGKKTLVHCAANYRVTAFFAIYAHEKLGWSRPQALALIASIWQPAEHPQWQTFITDLLG